MQKEKIKSVVVDILTWGGIISVFVVGYLVFIKPKTQSASPVVDPAVEIAAKTELIGADIDRAVTGMKELSKAVEESLVIFDKPVFQKLQDFSAMIPHETTGRENPFEQTAWKRQIKIDEFEAAVARSRGSGGTSQTTSVSLVASSSPETNLVGI